MESPTTFKSGNDRETALTETKVGVEVHPIILDLTVALDTVDHCCSFLRTEDIFVSCHVDKIILQILFIQDFVTDVFG